MRSSGLSSLALWKRERWGCLSSAIGGRLAGPRDFAKTEAWHPRCRHCEEPQATRQSPARGQARPIAGDCFAALAMTMLARSEEHTSELQSLMRTSYAVFCLKKKN